MKKFILNTGASLINQVTTIVVGMIMPYLFITYYGSTINGLINSINQFLGFISLCELGIGAVVRANLYKPLVSGDNERLSRVMKSAKSFFRKIAVILLGYVVVLVFAYPFLIDAKFDRWFVAVLIVIISVNLFAQYYLGITNQLLLTANQQAYIQLYINCATLAVNTVVCYAIIRAGASIVAVEIVTSALFCLRPIGLWLYVRKHYDIDYSVALEGESIEQKWNGFAQHIATLVQDTSGTVILTIFSTLKNVSVFSVYSMIIRGVMQIVYTVNVGIVPLLGHEMAKGNRAGTRRIFEFFEWGMHTSITILFIVTGVMIVPFVKIYTVNVSDISYDLPGFALMMTICGALRCVQLIYNNVIHAAGHFRETQIPAIIEPVTCITISIVAVLKVGIIGVTFGMGISLLYRTIYLIIYLKNNILNWPIATTIKQFVVDLIICSCVLVAIRICGISTQYSNYLEWIVGALLIMGITLVISTIANILLYRAKVFIVLNKILNGFKGIIRKTK